MDLARNWRLKGARYRLEGSECATCGEIYFPARKICRSCHARQQMPVQLQGRGEVYSHTTLHQAPAGFPTPYVVALVQLSEGPLVTAQLTDVNPDAVYIGMPVEMVTRKLSEQGENGLILYGYKFRPPVPMFDQEAAWEMPVNHQATSSNGVGAHGQDQPTSAALSLCKATLGTAVVSPVN